MLRDVDLSEVTDGKLYNKDDSVRVTCDDCRGCSECCKTVGDTILLDPFDIYNLEKALYKSFAEMVEKEIEIRLIDNVVLPNIMMQEDSDACGLLDENGRCTIHSLRPGFCRLFPLGRLYDEDSNFNYIIQVKECRYPDKGYALVKDWLGIEDLDKYERFIKDWHSFTKNIGAFLDECTDENEFKKYSWLPLRVFFEPKYDTKRDFYEQFYERMRRFK